MGIFFLIGVLNFAGKQHPFLGEGKRKEIGYYSTDNNYSQIYQGKG